MLCDMGAAATCLTLAAFLRFFPDAILENQKPFIIGAGNNDLKLYGVYTELAFYKGCKALGTFMVCKHLG